MFTRVAARLPINAAFAAKRVAPAAIRYNSSASSGSAARIVEMASQAERPDAANVAVPALWAVCGVLTYTAWNRMTERRDAGNVEKMLLV